MNPRCANLTPVLLALAACLPLAGADVLTVEPRVADAKYCLESSGAVTIHLTLRLKYRNNGEVPVLLPRFSYCSGYALFHDQDSMARNRPESRLLAERRRMLDTTKLDQSKPESEFFDTIAPGATLDNWPMETIIFLRYGPNSGQVVPDGDHLLRVLIDHWADHRAPGKRLRRRWKTQGLLWIEPIEAPAVKTRIDGGVKPGRCVGRVD
jgi:hypothetical protein